MSVVMTLHWPEITPELYEAARTEVHWEDELPDGAQLHVAWFAEDGFRVLDVWDSREAFERFVTERLNPVVVGKLGATTAPSVTYAPLHRRFIAPGVTGSSS
ncbi:carbohydrate kinase family protein [Kitasatospora azatica]|uniref:hypothetical protein n=1 Tax=Kitasatospora azatica TaxID=58347 RepID=UPI000568B34A|nr:hypothetical protein [Kitasatospora azatica]